MAEPKDLLGFFVNESIKQLDTFTTTELPDLSAQPIGLPTSNDPTKYIEKIKEAAKEFFLNWKPVPVMPPVLIDIEQGKSQTFKINLLYTDANIADKEPKKKIKKEYSVSPGTVYQLSSKKFRARYGTESMDFTSKVEALSWVKTKKTEAKSNKQKVVSEQQLAVAKNQQWLDFMKGYAALYTYRGVVIVASETELVPLRQAAHARFGSSTTIERMLMLASAVANKQIWVKPLDLKTEFSSINFNESGFPEANWVVRKLSSDDRMALQVVFGYEDPYPIISAWRIAKIKEQANYFLNLFSNALKQEQVFVSTVEEAICTSVDTLFWFKPQPKELQEALASCENKHLLEQEDAYPKGFIPEGTVHEIVDITFTGLTAEEAEVLLKHSKKNKDQVMIKKKAMKEIGGGKKEPIVVWPFQSDSMTVGGEPLMYRAQLNKDGTVSCNCLGWAMKKGSNERRCKHTDSIKAEATQVFKKWKNGESLGNDFVAASADVVNATAKSLSKAIKDNKVVGDGFTLMAKRVIEL